MQVSAEAEHISFDHVLRNLQHEAKLFQSESKNAVS